MANMKYNKRKGIAQKIADVTHTSSKQVISSTLPFITEIFKNNPKQAEELAIEFDLDPDEIIYLKK